MITQLAVILSLYMLGIVNCESRYQYHDIASVIDYLQRYTEMSMHEVLFLASPGHSLDQDTFSEEIIFLS